MVTILILLAILAAVGTFAFFFNLLIDTLVKKKNAARGFEVEPGEKPQDDRPN